jgi:ferritin
MLSNKMEEALNKQINAEWYSDYLYRSIAAYFLGQNLKGFAHWMRVQAGEEQNHGQKFFDYINDRNGKVTLTAIGAPPTEWKSPTAVFEAVYAHEQKVTGLINDLVAKAKKEEDNATLAMLQWFVTEQVEEEANAYEILEKLKMIKDSAQGLFMMDAVLAQRK